MGSVAKIYNLLNDYHKKYLLFLIALGFVAMALELIGIGSVIPLVYAIVSPESNSYIEYASGLFGYPDKNILIIIFLICILIVFLIKNLFVILLSWLQAKFGMLIQIDFAEKLMKFYLRANYQFHLKKNSSELINNLNREINQCVLAVKIIINLLTETIIIIGIFGLLLYVNVLSTIIISIIGILASCIFYFTFRKKLKIAGENTVKYERQKMKNIVEGFQGIKEIKIYNKINIFNKKFLISNNSIEQIKSNFIFLQSLTKQFYEILAIFLFVIVSLSVIILSEDPLELLKMVSVYAVAGIRLMPSSNKILSSFQQMRFALKGIEIIDHEFRAIKSKSISLDNYEENSIQNFKFNKNIKFENLSFQYENTNTKVLDGINFDINKGEIIKINGDSGKGKSTLVHLLVGLLKPTDGRITVDGKDLENFKESWKKIIGYVPQSIYLLDDTIRRNIAFGIPDNELSETKMNKVIEETQLSEFIKSLPNGLDTNVGELGSNISGGQLQRIGIARALYIKPDIIIFDEATNSLDKKNENEIINMISSYINITIIFISHDRELLSNCDKILDL